MAPLVLASRSPQRRAILEQLGIAFETRPSEVEEIRAGDPDRVVRENALRKARAVADGLTGEALVLAVDTEVVLDGQIYGKATDAAEARAHLERLSGRTHDVWSAVALVRGVGERVGSARTAVTLRRLHQKTLDWYLATGEWRGRAGAYAIQGRGSALVERIEGDYWNVVGLPVALLLDLAPELLQV